jgi:hypothetical protein
MNSLSPYPNGSAIPQANPIPAGFTKEKLNGLLQVCFIIHKIHSPKLFKCLFTIYQRAKLLQAQGAKEDNNQEFAQIMQFLKNLQMQSKMQQQRQSMPGAPPPQQSSPQNALPTGTVH